MRQETNFIPDSSPKPFNIRKITTLGMLAAMGIMLVAVIEIPLLPPPAHFLKYDPADIPILIGTMLYNPVAGLILTFVVSFVQSFMLHGSGGPIGFVMHFVATGAMTLVVGLVYHSGKKTMARAAVALALGVITMTVVMIGMNLLLTPIYMGVPISEVKKLLLPAIVPFNLIKAGINCVITFALYRVVGKLAKISS